MSFDPVVSKFVQYLSGLNSPPIQTLPVPDARDFLTRIQNQFRVESPQIEIADLKLQTQIGQVPVRVVRPPNVNHLLPGIIYVHGGGWILGDRFAFNHLISELAVQSKAAVVFVDYTRSPEAKYPVALKQIYATLIYVAEHGSDIGIDSSRIGIAGDSAGGNMATVTSMLAKENNGPKIKCQVLFYPVTDLTSDSHQNESYHQFTKGPWLTLDSTIWFYNQYQPDLRLRNLPTVSPLKASIEELRGMPPTLVITDENDVLRDEGEAYAHKLMEANVEVTAVRYLGLIHDFALLNGLAESPNVKSAISLAAITLKKALYSK